MPKQTHTPTPYLPSPGQEPAFFAGREIVLHGAREALAIAAEDGRTPRPLVLTGPPGMGKTATLRAIGRLAASAYGWRVVHVEAGEGRLLAGLVRRLSPGAGGPGRAERLAPSSPGAGLTQVLEQALAGEAARGLGLLLTLDDLHAAAPQEVVLLASALQESVPRNWPLVVAAGGSPSLRVGRGRRRLPGYLERAEWHELGVLEPGEARAALTEPAVHAGRPMSPAAVDVLLELAGRYPYALRVAGHHAWLASDGDATISVPHAATATPRIEAALTQLFRDRWEASSGREKEYLTALAQLSALGQPAPHGGQVAALVGRPAVRVSYLRDRLLKKGVVYADASNGLHFIAPGMGEWIRREVPT